MSTTNLEQTVIEYQAAGKDWIAAKLKSDQIEEGQKSYLAAIVNELDDGNTGEGKLERMARGTAKYRKYVSAMCVARAEMLKKKIRFDALGMLFDARRSEKAFEREAVKKGVFDSGQ